MINAMIEIIPDENSKFRNVVPDELANMIKEYQASQWEKRI